MNHVLHRAVVALEEIEEKYLTPLVEVAHVRIRPFQAAKETPEGTYDVVLTTLQNREPVHPHLPLLVIPGQPDAEYLTRDLPEVMQRSLTVNFSFPVDFTHSQVAQVAKASGKPMGEMMQFIAPNLDENLRSIEEALHAEAWDALANRIHAIRPAVRMLGAFELSYLMQTAELKLKQHNYMWTRLNGAPMTGAMKVLIDQVRAFDQC